MTPAQSLRGLLLVAACAASATQADALSVDWVTVGDPGNTCDLLSCDGQSPCNVDWQGCFGDVPYAYQILRYEVSNAQYAEFLNAVDPTGANPRLLYHASMSSDATFGGINLVAGNPNGSKYVVKTGFTTKPVVYVSFFDAIRFANWMANGQGAGSTEDGAYTLLGGSDYPTNGDTVTRNAGGTVYVASEDEWYKAAYYDAASQSYHRYPFADGFDGVACGAPPGGSHAANCNRSSLTDLGAYTGSPSAYGTFDQGGNVVEWNDTIDPPPQRVMRGGRAGSSPVPADPSQVLELSAAYQGRTSPSLSDRQRGFRVVGCSGVCGIPACSDGMDNDADGGADFPDDPGCYGPNAPREDPRCQNGADDDADGSIDFDGGASAGVPVELQTDPDPECFAAWPDYETLDLDWVTVGDPGNACDPQSSWPPGCFGAVPYSYRISKYEVTNAQYAAFLNAVAAADPNALYDTRMGSYPNGGITRNGSSGSHTYDPIAGRENMPVNWVSFYGALRFANWLDNGRPTGAQDDSTTEDGAYAITAQGIADNSITRSPAATIFLTSEDEWYKAAYYDPASASYFDYPAGTDAAIRCAEPGGWPNTASCEGVAGLTDVGGYPASASPYGTFDQGGNVAEWNEAIPLVDPEFTPRGVRGGSYPYPPTRSECAAGARGAGGATGQTGLTGFRVASCSGPCILGCSDGFDNDGDGLVDLEDPGCASLEDLTEIDDSGALVCDDGEDNDDDGLVDAVEDPGCDSVTDLTEIDDSGTLVCDDGEDNDDDGFVDVAEDPGCTSAADPTEIDDSGTLVCDDGQDNDDDGRIDFPEDPGCDSATDLTEEDPVCEDGLDNDADGLIDGADPGCLTPIDESTPGLACDDGLDNDRDGLIDLADPQCFSPFAGREQYVACGLGFELALLLPPLIWLRRRRRPGASVDGGMTIARAARTWILPLGALLLLSDPAPAVELLTDGREVRLHWFHASVETAEADPFAPFDASLSMLRNGFPVFMVSQDSSVTPTADGLGFDSSAAGTARSGDGDEGYFWSESIFSIGFRIDGAGQIDLQGSLLALGDGDQAAWLTLLAGDDVVYEAGGPSGDNGEGTEFSAALAPGVYTLEVTTYAGGDANVSAFDFEFHVRDSTIPIPCSDGSDDDGDGLADFPADPGCRSAAGGPEDPMCDDDLDNDGDGTIDWDGGSQSATPDANCTEAWKSKETRRCGLLGVEIALVAPVWAYRWRSAARRQARGRVSAPAA